MWKALRCGVLFISHQWSRGPEASARTGKWGWDGNAAPLQTAAASLRVAQRLGSSRGCRPPVLFQTRVRVANWYSQGKSLRSLQGSSIPHWWNPALYALCNSFQTARGSSKKVWVLGSSMTKRVFTDPQVCHIPGCSGHCDTHGLPLSMLYSPHKQRGGKEAWSKPATPSKLFQLQFWIWDW